MAPRTLLLAPPSISAHPKVLDHVYAIHDRSTADLQMLDRLAAGLVQLPPSTYDVVLLLTDADGTTRESHTLLDRHVMDKVVAALKAGGSLRSQDGVFGAAHSAEKTEAILAGLVEGPEGMLKPEPSESVAIPLKLRKKKVNGHVNSTTNGVTTAANGLTNGTHGSNGLNGSISTNGISNGTSLLNLNGKRNEPAPAPTNPLGVGFVDFSDDLDALVVTGEDDDLVDEDDLLTAEDMARPIIQPPECRPKAGKRRRACKDCSCGLKEKIEAEDAAKRTTADAKLAVAQKIAPADLAEVDFTVQGKVGSCGNCALGDAFRCDGCPYVGLPAFKPGEEVRLLMNDVQL